ncbi:DUF3558 domain-containing protein [Nonomuraea ceibae]|uniref:DUF3558 domain-containing protein n=1 Tax=Nonomuraea ceibae TaxID=1935170 RepID=UPI001C5D6B88|nr:DUF3558 domain-containing protein [Nonomuraea ceibae]
MIRVVLAVLVLLTAAACSAEPAPPRPTRAASPPPSGPGRFTGVVDPCSLLTAEQVEQLVTLAEQKYDEGGCTWTTPGLSLKGQAVHELSVGVHLAADVAAAHAFFVRPPDSAFPAMAVRDRPEPPVDAQVGDESFVQAPALGRHATVLAFRLGNAVVNINYGWRAKPAPRHQEGALKAARWIAEAMDRPAPAVADPADGRFAVAPYACSLLPEGVPESATQCGGLKLRLGRAWQGRSGIAVAKEIFAYYRRTQWPEKPVKPVKGLGDEAFAERDGARLTVWVRVSNLVLEIPFTKEDGTLTPEMRDEVANVLSRLPAR